MRKFWHIKPLILQWHKILNSIAFILGVGNTILAPTGDMAYRIVTVTTLSILMIEEFLMSLRIRFSATKILRLLHTQRDGLKKLK